MGATKAVSPFFLRGVMYPYNLCFFISNLLFRISAFSQLRFLDLAVQTVIFEIGPDKKEQTHIDICYPDKGKSRNQVASPIGIEQLIPCDQQEQGSYIKTETIFTGEQVEKLTAEQGL